MTVRASHVCVHKRVRTMPSVVDFVLVAFSRASEAAEQLLARECPDCQGDSPSETHLVEKLDELTVALSVHLPKDGRLVDGARPGGTLRKVVVGDAAN